MTTTAQTIIQRAAVFLQDVEGVRWPATELVDHLNDGQRALVEARPDATAEAREITLVAGHQQALDSDANCLVEVTRNATGKQRAIRQVSREMLDAVEPDWTSRSQRPEIIHFCHDMRVPREFIVYPPAVVGTKLQAVVSVYPTDVAQPSGPGFATVTGDISVPDNYANALLNYVLFRAWSKDAEFGGNASMAQTHYALFKGDLGEQLQSSATVAPKE